MWRVLDNLIRKLNAFWCEGTGRNMTGSNTGLTIQEKVQTTATDESYVSDEDSGFADDEGLYYPSSDTIHHSTSTKATHKHSDVHSGDSSEDENDFVMDSDLKNQQRVSLMSLLYSRALERKLNAARPRKPSYALREREHLRKHK